MSQIQTRTVHMSTTGKCIKMHTIPTRPQLTGMRIGTNGTGMHKLLGDSSGQEMMMKRGSRRIVSQTQTHFSPVP